MIKGRKVYDPLTNAWSTGYWIPVYSAAGRIEQYLPVWTEYEASEKKERSIKHNE